MMHMRRYFYKALDSDQERMGKALHLIARLYWIEDRAKGLGAEERLALRQRLSAPVMAKLHAYLLRIREEVLPKSPGARAVRYALNQWDALTRFLEDGDLEIDNGVTERVRVEPFAWFRDVLSRIATYPVHRLAELLPHNWKPLDPAIQS
jgi:transposase